VHWVKREKLSASAAFVLHFLRVILTVIAYHQTQVTFTAYCPCRDAADWQPAGRQHGHCFVIKQEEIHPVLYFVLQGITLVYANSKYCCTQLLMVWQEEKCFQTGTEQNSILGFVSVKGSLCIVLSILTPLSTTVTLNVIIQHSLLISTLLVLSTY
jgi:hypothetical protein